ncbi:MAG: helicase C-terminal domain-containing protein [Thermoprotei archaeon]
MVTTYDSKAGLRPYQKEAAERVVDALRAGKNVVLSMPTGSGKTLVSLVAALKYADGQVVSVFTRTIAEYQAWEREARRLGVLFSGHVGRDRVCRYGPREPNKEVEKEAHMFGGDPSVLIRGFRPNMRCSECAQNLLVKALQGKRLGAEGVDWDRVLRGRLGRELEAMQGVGVEAWVRGWRQRENGCGYPFARDAPTPLKLYTHLTYFLLWRYVGSPSAVYLFDEAHNLAGITRNLTFSLTYRHIAELIHQYEAIKEFGHNMVHDRRLREQLDGVNEVLDFLTELLVVASWEKNELPKPPSEVFEGDERIQRLVAYVNLVRDKPDVWRLRTRVECPNPRCRAENPAGARACSICGSKIEPESLEPRLAKFVPIDPSFLLRRLNHDRWVLLSGSMPNNWYLSNVLGLNNFEVVELNPFEKNLAYYLDGELDMSYSNRAKARSEAIDRALRLKAQKGITLLVTQNYEEVGWFKRLADFVETPDTTIAEVVSLVEERCEDNRPALIVGVARGKLFEGVEFKYKGRSAVSRIILLGVPYPNTHDEDFREMAEYLRDKKGVRIWDLIAEDAAIAAKQALGRAIRGPEDSAEVIFLDKRFKRLFKRIGVTDHKPLSRLGEEKRKHTSSPK